MGANEAAFTKFTDSIDIVFHVWPHCEDCRGRESRYRGRWRQSRRIPVGSHSNAEHNEMGQMALDYFSIA